MSEPAFPVHVDSQDMPQGMSLRDYVSESAYTRYYLWHHDPEKASELAFRAADAWLKARAK